MIYPTKSSTLFRKVLDLVIYNDPRVTISICFFGFGREGSWVVDLKGQVGEIIGFRKGQPSNHAQFEPSF